MAHLIPCPSCHSHVMEAERVCPHCGVALRTVTASRAPAVLLGLALTGCPTITAVYGVPDTGETATTTATATTGETEAETETSGGQTTMADSGSGSSMGTASESGTATDGSSGTAGSSSVGEPEYGVPETTGTGTGTTSG